MIQQLIKEERRVRIYSALDQDKSWFGVITGVNEASHLIQLRTPSCELIFPMSSIYKIEISNEEDMLRREYL